MASGSSLYSVIDIGSNSVRLVVFDVSKTPAVQLVNEKVFCGLARDLDQTGKLNPEGAEQALAGLVEYARTARSYDLARLDVVGTAALRDARDGAEFVRRAASDAGLQIRIISGHEEARYAALGVLALAPGATGLVADFGGGSLEFARIDDGHITGTLSRPYGAFRVMAMGPDAEKKLTAGLGELVPLYGGAPALHTIGGSWRALAQAYAQESGVRPETLQGYAVARDDMIGFCDRIALCDPDSLRARYGFEEKRSTLAPVSAFVLSRVLGILKPAQMVVSLAGIRDGIVYDFLHPARHPPTKSQENV